MARTRLAIVLALPLSACTGRALPGVVDGAPGPAPDAHGQPDVMVAPPAQGSITVQPGSFMMGSPDSEPCRLPNEVLHPVTLSRAYEIGATEVTQGAFLKHMGYNPSRFPSCGPLCPVDSVDWNAAVVFCNRLSEDQGLARCYSCVGDRGGHYAFPFDCAVRTEYAGSIYDCPGYRLPTEAEWENAYRAGSSTALSNGPIASCSADSKATAIAWYSANANGQPHDVGGRRPNAWGLYDMAGNLWEWVNDWYGADLGPGAAADPVGPTTGQGKVLRGGAWITGAGSIRGASRNQNQRTGGFKFVGFRWARTLGP